MKKFGGVELSQRRCDLNNALYKKAKVFSTIEVRRGELNYDSKNLITNQKRRGNEIKKVSKNPVFYNLKLVWNSAFYIIKHASSEIGVATIALFESMLEPFTKTYLRHIINEQRQLTPQKSHSSILINDNDISFERLHVRDL